MSPNPRMSRPLPLSSVPIGRPADPLRMLYLVIAALAFVRFAMARLRELAPDEAFYWLLGQHLNIGYLDHPPMVAWLIRLSTSVLGKSEFGVRAIMVLMSLGIIAMLLRLCFLLTQNMRAVGLLLAILATSPYTAALGLLATPDTPAAFFSLAALVCAVRLARLFDAEAKGEIITGRAQANLWFFFGMFCGLALLAKYTSILLPLGVCLVFLTSPAGRRQYQKPGIYLAGVVALLIFSPVIYWNAQHHWASFAFQLNHGLNTMPADYLKNLGEYVGGQLMPLTPILWLLGIMALVHYFRQWRTQDLAWRMLIIAAALPPVFFLLVALRSRGEANWPAFAYLPMSLLIVAFVLQQGERKRRGGQIWIAIGCAMAVLVTVVFYFPPLIRQTALALNPKKPFELPRKMVDFYEWRSLGQFIASRTAGQQAIVCNTYEDAGEIAFYLPQPGVVWAARLGTDARMTAFDCFDDPPPWQTHDLILLVNGNTDEFCARYGYTPIGPVERYTKIVEGHLRDREVTSLMRLPGSLPATVPVTLPATPNFQPDR